jgi:hypothetical protein
MRRTVLLLASIAAEMVLATSVALVMRAVFPGIDGRIDQLINCESQNPL